MRAKKLVSRADQEVTVQGLNIDWLVRGIVYGIDEATCPHLVGKFYRPLYSNGGGGAPLATGVTGTSYSDQAVQFGTTYFYKVTAVNAAEIFVALAVIAAVFRRWQIPSPSSAEWPAEQDVSAQ